MTLSNKKIDIRVATAFIAVLTSFAVYSLTPSATSQIDNKLNALFSQCSSSLFHEDEINHGACYKLFETYSNVAKSGAYHYLSDTVMFELHREIAKHEQAFDISEATNGFMQLLPSGKYHTTRRTTLIDAVFSNETAPKGLSDQIVTQ